MKLITIRLLILFLAVSSMNSYLRKRLKRDAQNTRMEAMGPAKYLMKGFDIRKYDPLNPQVYYANTNIDYIFDFVAENSKINYKPIETPEGIDISSFSLETNKKNRSMISTMEDFKREMNTSVGGGIPSPMAFTMSASYKTMSNQVQSSKVEIISDITEKPAYKMTLEYDNDNLKLSKEFQKALVALPEKYSPDNKAEYKKFFNRFGTHFIQELTVGYKHSTITKNMTSKSSTEKSKTVGVEAESIFVNTSASHSTDNKNSNENENSNTDSYTIGSKDKVNDMFPITIQKIIPIKEAIEDQKLKHKFDGIDEVVECELEGTPEECGKPEEKIDAVVDILFKYYEQEPSGAVSICPIGYDNVRALEPLEEKGDRYNIREGKKGGGKKYIYFCKKIETVKEEGETFIDPMHPPKVYIRDEDMNNAKKKVENENGIFKCARIPNKDNDLNFGDESTKKRNLDKRRYLCWRETSDITNGVLSDVAIANYQNCSGLNDQFTGIYPYSQDTNVNNYACYCTNLNKDRTGNESAFCSSPSKLQELKNDD